MAALVHCNLHRGRISFFCADVVFAAVNAFNVYLLQDNF